MNLSKSHYRKTKERAIEGLLLLATCVSLLTTLGIAVVLIKESALFFTHVPLTAFFTDTVWMPLFSEPRYGVMPLLVGTLMTSLVALCVALPLGIILAIFLSEFASRRLREYLKPSLELLAGVPTVVYGYFAINAVIPLLQLFIPELPGFNILGAGIVMGLAILPYVTTLAEDAMRAVPLSLREASAAMGATKLQSAWRVVVPAARSGIIAAIILAIARAIGETMIVAIAAGMQPKLTMNPLEQAQTASSYIVQVAMGDLPHGSIGYQSIFAVGLVLFVFTLTLNLIAQAVRRRQ